jgi:lactoylglutathione lyase
MAYSIVHITLYDVHKSSRRPHDDAGDYGFVPAYSFEDGDRGKGGRGQRVLWGTVMKLNHLNLTVTDVLAARDFLERYFGLRSMGGNTGMAFLSDDDGFVLTLMKAGRAPEVAYPGNFHVGFFVESYEIVNEINNRLKDDGFDVAPPEQHHAYTFYVEAPGGFTVELGS